MKKFRDQYCTDNERIVASDALIQKTIIKMKGSVMKNNLEQKKKYLFRGIATLTVVSGLVFGLGLYGNRLLKQDSFDNVNNDSNQATQTTPTAQSHNRFSFSVSAAEPTPETKQLALTQEKSEQSKLVATSARDNANTLYLYNAIDFNYEGENIDRVELSVDRGYFGYFYFVEAADPKDDISEFVKYGSTYTVSKNNPARSEQLYWGIDYQNAEIVFPKLPDNIYEMTPDEQNQLEIDPIMVNGKPEPDSINIKASVTFTDGEIREQSLVYQLDNGSLRLSE